MVERREERLGALAERVTGEKEAYVGGRPPGVGPEEDWPPSSPVPPPPPPREDEWLSSWDLGAAMWEIQGVSCCRKGLSAPAAWRECLRAPNEVESMVTGMSGGKQAGRGGRK